MAANAVQPDFRAVAEGFHMLGEQLGRCVNLPAVDHGVQILAILAELRDAVVTLGDRVEQQRLDIQAIGVRLAAESVSLFLTFQSGLYLQECTG